MKLILSVVAVTFAFLAPTSVAAQPATGRQPAAPTQRPAATSPAAPQSTGVVADGKIGIIDTEAFADPKTGITKLVNAFEVVNREFKPSLDELTKLRAQFEQLGKDIEATK